MRTHGRWVRTMLLLGGITTGGMLFAGSGLACAGFGADQAQSMVDFCFLFDCDQGAFGGLIDFCSRPADGEEDGYYFFEDCPRGEETAGF